MDYTVFSTEFPDVKVFYNEPLKNYTFTKTGGRAAILIFPKDKKEAIIIEPDSYVKELENIRKIKILKKI